MSTSTTYDYKQAVKDATGTIDKLNGKLCIFKCVKCLTEYNTGLEALKETKGVCRAGRGRTDNGCTGKLFMQGNYHYSPTHCWHLIPVPIGQTWEKARASYLGRST